MKIRQSGFTLIELLLTVTVLSVLVTLAIPGFRSMFVNRSLQATVDAFIVDMRYARSEAIKRSARVSVCSSSDGSSCTTSGTNTWKDGWLVFVDKDGDGLFETGDEIVRVQEAWPNILSILGPTPNNDLRKFVFQPTGWSRASSQTFTFTPAGGDGATYARLVCISNQGRASLRPKGVTACN